MTGNQILPDSHELDIFNRASTNVGYLVDAFLKMSLLFDTL